MAEPIRRPEVSVLADYVEGLLDADTRTQVERHVAEDPETAALVAELEALPGLLAATPLEPMPADVVARVDAALARESQDRASQPVPDRVGVLRRSRRWLLPVMAAAATAGVVAIAVPVVLDGSGQQQSLDSANDAPASQERTADDAVPEPLSEGDPEGAGSGGAGGLEEAGEPPALTSAGFASQVEALYADAQQATGKDLDPAGPSEAYTQPMTVPAEARPVDVGVRVAPLCYGDLEKVLRTAIAFDGRPAYLLVYEPFGGGDDPQQAVAFRCRGDQARVLDQQAIELP